MGLGGSRVGMRAAPRGQVFVPTLLNIELSNRSLLIRLLSAVCYCL